MVDIIELRVGNLICWNPRLSNPNGTLPAITVQVSAIMPDKIGYTSPMFDNRVEPFEDDKMQMEITYRLLKELEPIALTSAIVKSAGFEKESGSVYKHKTLDLYFDVKKNAGHYLKKKFSFRDVFFVHQLQNIYFILSGKELELIKT